jgi:hypothetical protein
MARKYRGNDKKLRQSRHKRYKRISRQVREFEEFCEVMWDLIPIERYRDRNLRWLGTEDAVEGLDGEGNYGVIPRERFFELASIIKTNCAKSTAYMPARRKLCNMWIATLKQAWLTTMEREMVWPPEKEKSDEL